MTVVPPPVGNQEATCGDEDIVDVESNIINPAVTVVKIDDENAPRDGATHDACTADMLDSASDSAEDETGFVWTPPQANFPFENVEEKHPLLNSTVGMRAVKGYVNGENLVPMTTYSFIVTTGGHGPATNLVNILVLVLQMASFVAVITSIFDFSNPNNPCQIPANVESSVRASQFLSLVYSICVQGGVISTLYTFRNGYDEDMLRKSFPDCAPNSTWLRVRWYISLGLILLLGLLAQILTFVLIMQSSTVLGVLLNYAAVSFISTIDDRLFYLGKRGWLGKEVEKQVRLVCLADEVDPKPTWYHRLAHTLALLAIFGCLIVSWVVVVSRQTNGTYLPHEIFVQFGDEANPALGTFSGLYSIEYERDRVFSSDRSLYTEIRSRKAHFGYCEKTGSWSFQYNVTKEEFDACEWSAKSSPTETFDIVTTALSQWYGKNQDGRVIPMSRASIGPSDCLSDAGLCGRHGSCSAGECVCDEGWFGLFCGFHEPCPKLELDARRGDSLGSAERRWSTRYEILRLDDKVALVHDYPVYVTETDPPGLVAEGKEDQFDIIFFTGRRWAISFSTEFLGSNGADLKSYLSDFHAEFSSYRASFLSEPITPILESLSPVGLRWFFADPPLGGMQAATTQELDAGFVCAECSDERNPCFYDGVCGNSGNCKCSAGSKGSLCENPPVGNGRCDPYFNKLQFNMDGGDCCRATCVSTTDFTCGKDETGFLDTGFFFCESSDPIRTETINGDPFAELGRIVAISENGYLMAATTRKADIAVYDKRGAIWNKRFVLNACKTAVTAMDMSGGPFTSNPFMPETPFVLVAACEGSSEPVLYYCRDGSDCTTTRLEKPEEADDSFGSAVAVSRNGGVVAISSRGDDPGSSLVSISRVTSSDGGGLEWSGGSNEVIVPMRYYRSPINGTLTVPLQRELNVTLVRNVTVELVPKPQFILSTSLSNEGALALAASDNPDSILNQIHYYQWNGSIWEETGVPLDVTRCSEFPADSMVQLSDDGKILLVADGTKVNVFKWDDESNDWILRGSPIQQSECSIKNVALSASGSEIAVNSLYDDGEEVLSRILTFNWSDSEWQRRERRDDSIEYKGNSTLQLALSYHGRELAVGRPQFPTDHSGRVQTFEFPRSTCEKGFERFRITMTIQPNVTKWSLVSLSSDNKVVSVSGGPYFFPDFLGAADAAVTHHDGATVVEELCVPEQRCGNFTLYPPGFGGAAFAFDEEVRIQPEKDAVYSMLVGALNATECEQLKTARKKRSISGNETFDDIDDMGDDTIHFEDDDTY